MIRLPLGMVVALVAICLLRTVQTAAADASPAKDEAAALKRVADLGGKVRFDARKTPIGVDLLNCATTDADVKLLTSLAHLRNWLCGAPTLRMRVYSILAASRSFRTWCSKTLRSRIPGWTSSITCRN